MRNPYSHPCVDPLPRNIEFALTAYQQCSAERGFHRVSNCFWCPSCPAVKFVLSIGKIEGICEHHHWGLRTYLRKHIGRAFGLGLNRDLKRRHAGNSRYERQAKQAIPHLKPHRILPYRNHGGFDECPQRVASRPSALHFLLSLRSEEHTSELQSLMRISYAVFCLKKKNNQ